LPSYPTRKSSPFEQTVFIYIDLGRTHAGAGITPVENGVEVTHEEKKFSESEKISRAKSKNRKRLPVLQQGGTHADDTAT
jgi:hypothetical protein